MAAAAGLLLRACTATDRRGIRTSGRLRGCSPRSTIVPRKRPGWVRLGEDRRLLKIVVKQPEVEHKSGSSERWLERPGRTPAEVILKNRVRTACND